MNQDLDDAVQEVFIECFRQGNALAAVGDGRVPNFRAFLYGVVRNIARRFESRPLQANMPLPEIAADDASLSRLFDRSWAKAIMAEAARLQRTKAMELGEVAVQRVELLRLRFEENLPIRVLPNAGAWRRPNFIIPMPWPGGSFGRPCWNSSPSIIPPAPRSWRRRPLPC